MIQVVVRQGLLEVDRGMFCEVALAGLVDANILEFPEALEILVNVKCSSARWKICYPCFDSRQVSPFLTVD
jgi:hypothetical protein